MRVGSLRSPWEYDGRLPPDAGYYLDLVLPRKEEPRKKIGSRARLLHGRMLQIQWSNYMQLYSRLSANLLVILVNIPVNLLVKLTELGQGGPSGPGLGLTNSRWACSCVVLLLANLFGVWPKAQGPITTRRSQGLWRLRETMRPFVRLRRRDKKDKKRLPLYDFHRFLRLSWDEYWESCQTILLLCYRLVVTIPILQICASHIVDQFLPIALKSIIAWKSITNRVIDY